MHLKRGNDTKRKTKAPPRNGIGTNETRPIIIGEPRHELVDQTRARLNDNSRISSSEFSRGGKIIWKKFIRNDKFIKVQVITWQLAVAVFQ